MIIQAVIEQTGGMERWNARTYSIYIERELTACNHRIDIVRMCLIVNNGKDINEGMNA